MQIPLYYLIYRRKLAPPLTHRFSHSNASAMSTRHAIRTDRFRESDRISGLRSGNVKQKKSQHSSVAKIAKRCIMQSLRSAISFDLAAPNYQFVAVKTRLFFSLCYFVLWLCIYAEASHLHVFRRTNRPGR